MAFTPISTQEELDRIISERLTREAKKYEKYTSPDDLEKIKADHADEIRKLNGSIDSYKTQLEGKDKDIADRDAKIKGYETDSVKKRIAHEAGLPEDAADYLKGKDAEALKKSAESLKAIIGDKPPAPMKDTEPSGGENKDAAYRSMLAGLKGEE